MENLAPDPRTGRWDPLLSRALGLSGPPYNYYQPSGRFYRRSSRPTSRLLPTAHSVYLGPRPNIWFPLRLSFVLHLWSRDRKHVTRSPSTALARTRGLSR